MEENKKDGSKIIVIQDGNAKEPGQGLTFPRYGRGLKKYWPWWAGATVLMGLVGFLVTKLAINPKKEKLTATFSYDIPTIAEKSDNAKVFYFDGTPFNYRDIISASSINGFLAKDKAGEKKYTNLSTDIILKDNTFAISQSVDANGAAVVPATYTINAGVAPFSSTEQASSFTRDLIDYTAELAKAKVESYKISDSTGSIDSSTSFKKSTSILSTQYQRVSDAYTFLLFNFSENTAVSDSGTTLQEYHDLFLSNFSNGSENEFTKLSRELLSKHYVNFTDSTLDSNLEELKSQGMTDLVGLTQINGTITNLKTVIGTSDRPDSASYATYLEQLNTALESQETLKTDLLQLGYVYTGDASDPNNYTLLETTQENYDKGVFGQIQHLEWYKGHKDTDSWGKEVAGFRDEISSMTAQLTSWTSSTAEKTKYLYRNSTNGVHYSTSSGILSSGHVSSVLVLFLSAILGFAVSSLITGEIVVVADRKAKNEETKKEDKPVSVQ